MKTSMRELGVLRESAASSAERVQALEQLNNTLRNKIEDMRGEIVNLQKGAVDLHSERELMRQVIVEQSETLVRRVENLTDERKTADDDRKQLLATAADLLGQVEGAESRLAKRSDLENDCCRFEACRETLAIEVERLSRTNDALCQQVFGEDGDGPHAGALSATYDVGDGGGIQDEVRRLVRGQLLQTIQSGSVQADASMLSLRLQQTLAEREEAFWVERQRLSDRVAILERSRGGRTGALLRSYGAAVNGSSTNVNTNAGDTHKGIPSGLAAAPVAAAAAVTDGLRRLRDSWT